MCYTICETLICITHRHYNIIGIMLFFYFLHSHYKSEPLNLLSVLFACFHSINARGVHVRMSQNIRKPYNILLHLVERPREQVAQVVREHLSLVYVRALAQFFHVAPYVCSVKRLAAPCDKYCAALYPAPTRVF